MPNVHHFTKVEFTKFKAFSKFSLDVKAFNILVGPNNAGKSTILTAFRILAAALRKATSKKPEAVQGPNGLAYGYKVDLEAISIAEENIFYNYDDSEAALVEFGLSNGNSLTLYFPEQGTCILLPETTGRAISGPRAFQERFNCKIGFVPILGPVEHEEPLYGKEAARMALFNYRAARNFRNIWYHYPDRFEEFRTKLQETWPGMDIEKPEIDTSHAKPRLNMFCPEQRIPREIFWSGFGFQVWCQMLTHVINSKDNSIFLIDEPDIYLHSDLQRQLLEILRNLGPDIIIATHSTEIITEAETNDIVLINKKRKRAKRIKDPSELEEVFSSLGSNLNPILTQLAKTRRALFVEGKDFQILGRFANKLKNLSVGNRRDFAVIPIEGFNPSRARSLLEGIEATLGSKVAAAVVLDRDYRCEEECESITRECASYFDEVAIHKCKEIENFLLVPDAIDRALQIRIADNVRRTGVAIEFEPFAKNTLDEFALAQKNYINSQLISERRRFNPTKLHDASLTERSLEFFDAQWADLQQRMNCLPGKEAISYLNKNAQEKYGVTVSSNTIIEAMKIEEIPPEVKNLIELLTRFSSFDPRNRLERK